MKAFFLSLLIIGREQVNKHELESGQESTRDVSVLSHCSLLRNIDQNRPVCWSIVVKEKPTVGFTFPGTFPSNRIPEATNDVSVHFFMHSINSCKLYQRIPGTS